MRPSAEVIDIETNELIASLRLPEHAHTIRVPGSGTYQVLVRDQSGKTHKIQTLRGGPIGTLRDVITVDFTTIPASELESSELSAP